MSPCEACQAEANEQSRQGAEGQPPGVCPVCGTTSRVPVRLFLDWLVPAGVDLTPALRLPDPIDWPGYDDKRAQATSRSGADEAVQVVRGSIRGSDAEAVVVAWEFGFLGGSMGSDAGERIATGFDLAREAGLPVLLATSSGGARMQEGMASLAQMAVTTVASRQHARAGLLQVALVRDPTTGGVFASHANLCDVIIAEPGATIGFAGPRVAEEIAGGTLSAQSHTAEGALAAGLIDAVVARADLPEVLARLLDWPGPGTSEAVVDRAVDGNDPTGAPPAAGFQDGATSPTGTPPAAGFQDAATSPTGTPPAAGFQDGATSPTGAPSAWDRVRSARSPGRLRAPAYLRHLDVVFELHGDRGGEDDPAIRPVLARLDGRCIMVIAMDPTFRPNPGSGAYRKAWRGLRLAGRLGVPVVTLIDTPGADVSAEAEAAGIAHHIAMTFVEVLDVPTPVVTLVIGEGGSGGAIALAVGDRLLIQESAMFSVISPEGAATILFRDAGRARDAAELLDVTADRLFKLGLADEIVAEPTGQEVVTAWHAVAQHLDAVDAQHGSLVARRAVRWRNPVRSD